ncbi:MAG: Hsp20/alpha crystallin family protein [Desulfobulbaceae bacterium]|nr:Hsp20/alpha crystallin family protein [Desulfobulbaceae bacterium]
MNLNQGGGKMAIIRFRERPFLRSPWSEFERMRHDMDALLRTMNEVGGRDESMVYPLLNIFEDNDHIYVHGEVPGVLPEDLNVSVESETLIIKGERKTCNEVEDASWHRREIQCGTFSRAISLPTKVNTDQVEARVVDGILTVTIAKADEVKPRQVEIKVG